MDGACVAGMVQLIGAAAAAAGAGLCCIPPALFPHLFFSSSLHPCVLRGACTARRVTLTGMLSPSLSLVFVAGAVWTVSNEGMSAACGCVEGESQPIADVAVAAASKQLACIQACIACMCVTVVLLVWPGFCVLRKRCVGMGQLGWGWMDMLACWCYCCFDLSMGISWRV